jgi:hypothetical protein
MLFNQIERKSIAYDDKLNSRVGKVFSALKTESFLGEKKDNLQIKNCLE